MLTMKFELLRLCRSHREGSHATQAARRDTINSFVNTLDQHGFSKTVRQKGVAIKERHVKRVVDAWQRAGTGSRTIANRLAHLRRLTEWQGHPGTLKASNSAYIAGREAAPGRGHRHYADRLPNTDKAVHRIDLDAVRSPHARASLMLQKEFGLRREETLKIRPEKSTATMLVLHGSACKGGRPREITVRTDAQRAALTFAKEVAGAGSLIPPRSSYVAWRDGGYRKACIEAGLPGGSHGLRHAYAQGRYAELTGFKAPLAGGPWRSEMDDEQRKLDDFARDIVSQELGHGRRQVCAQYLGGYRAPDSDE